MWRILTIDGGGVKGVFPASFLATLEDALGDRVANYFDLIVGTSTGGIIALGLGLGLSAQNMLRLYVEKGPVIFGGHQIGRWIRSMGWSKYDSQPLRQALEAAFGDTRLGQSTKRLVIPSCSLETGKVHVYKTAHHERLERDYKERVVDVALATAAAPTYFPTHRSAVGTPLVDGGLWANNPVGMAVVEAIGILGWPRDAIRVLSLGCTTEPLRVGWARRLPFGQLYWGLKVTDVFLAAQSSASFGTAQLLVGHQNVVRISPHVPHGRFSLDGWKEINSLRGLGDTEAREALPSLRPLFFQSHAEPFTPHYQLLVGANAAF